MNELIDYAKLTSTRAMFAAHLINARLLVSDELLRAQEASKRFGETNDAAAFAVYREANDTLTVAKRHGLTAAEPIGVHKGKEYGVVRGKVTFLRHFERDRSFS